MIYFFLEWLIKNRNDFSILGNRDKNDRELYGFFCNFFIFLIVRWSDVVSNSERKEFFFVVLEFSKFYMGFIYVNRSVVKNLNNRFKIMVIFLGNRGFYFKIRNYFREMLDV